MSPSGRIPPIDYVDLLDEHAQTLGALDREVHVGRLLAVAPAGHPSAHARIRSQGLHQGEDWPVDGLGDVVGRARWLPIVVLHVIGQGGRARSCDEPDRIGRRRAPE